MLRLLVQPALGPLDPAAVEDAFLDALGAGGGVQRLAEAAWRRHVGFLSVECGPPETTPGGKIQHLHAAPWSRPSRAAELPAPPPP